MTNVDYKALKSCIIRCCSPRFKNDMAFKVDMDKLVEEVGAMNLVPIFIGMMSKKLTPDIIPFIGEYYEKERLEWFSEDKEYTILTFVDRDDINDELTNLLEDLKTAQVNNPDDDKVHDTAVILAKYHCYNALVVSYKYLVDKEDDPNERHHREHYVPYYSIMCRANKVVIKDSNYQYNPHDMS